MGGGIAYDDGKIFVTTGFGVVIALDARNRQATSGRSDLGVPIVNAPVVNGGRIFVSTQDNHFYALAEADGRQLWDHQGIAESAGILATTSAAVPGEFVIAPYTSGEIFALRVQNGQPAWNDVLSAFRPRHRAVRAGRHRRPAGDRPRHGLSPSAIPA